MVYLDNTKNTYFMIGKEEDMRYARLGKLEKDLLKVPVPTLPSELYHKPGKPSYDTHGYGTMNQGDYARIESGLGVVSDLSIQYGKGGGGGKRPG